MYKNGDSYYRRKLITPIFMKSCSWKDKQNKPWIKIDNKRKSKRFLFEQYMHCIYSKAVHSCNTLNRNCLDNRPFRHSSIPPAVVLTGDSLQQWSERIGKAEDIWRAVYKSGTGINDFIFCWVCLTHVNTVASQQPGLCCQNTESGCLSKLAWLWTFFCIKLKLFEVHLSCSEYD